MAWNYIRWDILRYIQRNKLNTTTVFSKDGAFNDEVDDSYSYTSGQQLWEVMPESLPKKERTVLELRATGLTFQEIGHELGCSKSWVSRLFKSAKRKILAAT